MKTQPVIIQADFNHTQQSWHYTQTVKVGDAKFRTRLKRDAYDFQSYAVIERWNGDEWKEVISRPLSTMLFKDVPAYAEQLTAEQKGLFEFDADALLLMAIEVAS